MDTVVTESAEAAKFREAITGLELNQSRFAGLMNALGDRREMKTILRSIQRMAGEEARVSGEMQVILTLLEREQARAQRLVEATEWRERTGGGYVAEIQGVRLSLSPETRGRWRIHAQYVAEGPGGYSPSFPHLRSNLDEAKLRAVLAVDETLDHMERIQAELAER